MPSATAVSRYPVKLSWPSRLRHSRTLICVLVVSAIGIVALPASAGAKPGFEVRPASLQIVLPVKKGLRYVASISVNEHRRVRFLFDASSSAIEYSTSGYVSDRAIEADFGALGRISVKLHLVKRPVDPSHKGRCKGQEPRYEEGSYRGTIEFTHLGPRVRVVEVTHGHVYVMRRSRQVCKRERTHKNVVGNNKTEVSVLTVEGQAGNRLVSLQASSLALRRNPSRSLGQVDVAVLESISGVRVTRTASTSTDQDSFSLSPPGATLEAAKLELPKPFTGQAVYLRSRGTLPSWSGDLSVNLPVVGSIPLTGFGFSAILCRTVSMVTLKSCS